MAETWPITLPQYVNRDGFSYELSNSSISASMSTGYAKRRKKFTGQYATYMVSMNMTQAQADIFEQFFNNNLGYGTEYMDFPDPLFIDATIECRIKCGTDSDPYTVVPYGDNDDVVVSFELERLITGYTSVTITTWPSTLPQCPIYNDYSTSTQAGLIRDSDYSLGYVSVRRRFTAVTRYHYLDFIMDGTQLVAFMNFYASLGYGAKNFTAPWPIDTAQTIKARFDAEEGYGVAYYGDTNLFTVTFTWEELPPLLEWS